MFSINAIFAGTLPVCYAGGANPVHDHMNLRECFDKHGCDRGWRHGYERVYEGLQPRHILEVGVFKGAGVEAWLDYTHAVISGVDTFERTGCIPPTYLYNHPRVSFYWGDSRTIELDGKFDLIIDDAAHDPDSQRKTFNNLFPLCNGSYFIEDVWALDVFSQKQLRHKWIQRPEYSMARYKKLLDTVSQHNLIRHDLRKGYAPDSYLFEVRSSPSRSAG